MIRPSLIPTLLLAAAPALAGPPPPKVLTYCGEQPADFAPSDKTGRGLEMNGPQLNGVLLYPARTRDKLLPGERAGHTVDVIHLRHGVLLPNGKITCAATLAGTALRSEEGSGQAFRGALLIAHATDGKLVHLRVDDVLQGQDAGLLSYKLSWQPGALAAAPEGPPRWRPGKAFAPLCADGKRAFLLAGRWDYHRGQAGDSGKVSSEANQVTVGCEDGAIAKCLRFGYLPWESAQHDALHQACVRAVRADYCGDGATLTAGRVVINLYDEPLGVQKDTEDWPFEASWTSHGALCVGAQRPLRIKGGGTLGAHLERRCRPTWRKLPDQQCLMDPQKTKPVLFTETRQ